MDVQMKDTFFESVEKLVWYDSKLWKAWEFIKIGLPNFFKNIWRFRKELYNHQWWDYRFTLEMLYRSLVIMEKDMHDGIEVRESREKKITKMQRAIQLLENRLNDNYIQQAEKELGEIIHCDWEFEETEHGTYRMKDNESKEEKEHNGKVFKLAQTIDDNEWKELWEIFKGQDITKYRKLYNAQTDKQKHDSELWNDWFDGSDMRGWWD